MTIAPAYYPAFSNDATMVRTYTLVLPGAICSEAASGYRRALRRRSRFLSYPWGLVALPGRIMADRDAANAINKREFGRLLGSPVAFTSTSISDGERDCSGSGAHHQRTRVLASPRLPGDIAQTPGSHSGSYSSGTGALFLFGDVRHVCRVAALRRLIQAQVSTTAGVAYHPPAARPARGRRSRPARRRHSPSPPRSRRAAMTVLMPVSATCCIRRQRLHRRWIWRHGYDVGQVGNLHRQPLSGLGDHRCDNSGCRARCSTGRRSGAQHPGRRPYVRLGSRGERNRLQPAGDCRDLIKVGPPLHFWPRRGPTPGHSSTV